jgi:hypothetical protein
MMVLDFISTKDTENIFTEQRHVFKMIILHCSGWFHNTNKCVNLCSTNSTIFLSWRRQCTLSFRSYFRQTTSTRDVATTTNPSDHPNTDRDHHRTTNKSYLKTYCINGHTSDHNFNSCVGMTGLQVTFISSNNHNHCTNTTIAHNSDRPQDTSHHVQPSNHNHVMYTDLPTSMGGMNAAPQPIELLLMSYIGDGVLCQSTHTIGHHQYQREYHKTKQ